MVSMNVVEVISSFNSDNGIRNRSIRVGSTYELHYDSGVTMTVQVKSINIQYSTITAINDKSGVVVIGLNSLVDMKEIK